MNRELPDVQAGFGEGRGTIDNIANTRWITEKARVNICFMDYAKAFDCVEQTNCGKFLEMGLSDHLTCFLRNLYASKEATVRTGHETMNWFQIRKVQFSSVTQSCLSLCDPMDCITNSQSLLKLVSIESVMPSNHLILCHPLLLPSVFPCIRDFSSESFLRIWWPKYWSFSFRISPSKEYSELISFRID